MPTVDVTFFGIRVPLKKKRELADSLTKVFAETLGSPTDEVTIVFRAISGNDISRGGRLGTGH